MNSEISLAGQQLVTGDIETNNQMNKMLKVPRVEPIYTKCKNDNPNNISNCVWTEISKDENKAIKEAVLEAAKKSPPTASPLKENFSTDPALVELGKIIGKKLQDALYGPDDEKNNKDSANGKFSQVDQKKFSDIYRAELSKTMVDAFLSYCLDTTNPDNRPPSSTMGQPDFNKNRSDNIAALQGKNGINPRDFLERKPNGKDTVWNICLAGVQNDCNDTNPVSLDQKNRACLVTQYVESAKKNLHILDVTDTFYKSLEGVALKSSDSKIAPPPSSSTAALVTVTSKDIESAYKAADETANKEIKECTESGDNEKCKKFLSTNTKENKEADVEYRLQQEADKANFVKRLEEVQDTSKDDLIKFLEERGYTKEEIKGMNLSDVAGIKTKIKTRYENEKDALIKEMNARVEKKTSKNQDNANNKDDAQNLDTIKKELGKRTQDMKNLTLFNNVVSGYIEGHLDGTDADKKDRSTASLALELGSSDESKTIKQNLEKQGAKIDAAPTKESDDKLMDAKTVGALVDPAPKLKEE